MQRLLAMGKKLRKFIENDSGQGMVEYILIIGLVVLFIVVVMIAFRDAVIGFINKVIGWINGQSTP
jgi:Flp pilus assembly pilin Flp